MRMLTPIQFDWSVMIFLRVVIMLDLFVRA